MKRYTSIKAPVSAEQTIEKSRFIAYLSPAESREAADSFIAEIKKRHKDATHNVPAFVIGTNMELVWASDDGEPQGTSGAPMAQMLQKEGLTNIVVVVTRYFGGIKLGTGGLVRAYTSSLKLALEKSERHVYKDVVEISFVLDYNLLARLKNMEKEMPFTIEDILYEDKLKISMSFEPEYEENITGSLMSLTAGKFKAIERSEKIC